jgi:hypothetical protein
LDGDWWLVVFKVWALSAKAPYLSTFSGFTGVPSDQAPMSVSTV